MKRKTLFAVLCILCAMMLAACQCKHEWTEANCVNARTCSRCGEQEGQPQGHVLSPATCQTASRCSKCGGTVGTPADHSWQSATCTSPQICTVCSAVSGEALEHDWAEVVNQSGIPGRMCGVCMEMELRTDRWLPLTKLEKISASNEDGHYNDILTGDWNTRAGKLPDSIRFCVSGKESYKRTHYCIYELDKNFSYLSGLISFDDQSENYSSAKILIYMDNELEFESINLSDVSKDQSFTLDVRGVDRVRIVCTTEDDPSAYCVLSASVY